MDSSEKRAINIALQALKKLPRYSLEWEWMAQKNDGDYLDFNEVEKTLLEMLKS